MKITLLFLFSLVCASSFAVETVTLDTIKVKGTKERKNYFEHPESILILQENEVSATGSTNSIQVINAAPNVQVNNNWSGKSFSIRGIKNTGVTNYGLDNLASIVIDDLFQTDLAIQAGNFNLWDLERIEVLRGAQSTNQGVNSLAGSILLDHKKPILSNEGAAKLGLGSFWHREVGVVTNNVISKDKVATRVSYDKEMNDGYIKNIKTRNDKWGQWNRDRAALGLLYKISDNSTLNLDGKFNSNDRGGTYTQGKDALKHEVDEDQDYNMKTSNYQLSATHTYTISEKTNNTIIFGFSKGDENGIVDGDGTAKNISDTRLEQRNDHYFSFENRIFYKDDKISNLLGVHAHNFELKDNYDYNLLLPLQGTMYTPIALKLSSDWKRKACAIFDSFTYQFSEKHSAIAGLRGEYTDVTYGASTLGKRLEDLGPFNGFVDGEVARVSGSYEGTKPSFVLLPKIGYLFTTGPHHSGLTYARAYRTAGLSINRIRATAVEYNPEFTNNYEASYKYSSEDFQFSSNIFYTDWQDQQVQVQLSDNIYDSQVQNAAKSEVYGAEAEGRFRLSSNQILATGVGYLDTKFKEFKTITNDYAGKQFPFASHWTGRLSHELKPNDNMSFLTILRHVSDSYANAENTRGSDAQFYLDWSTKYVLRSLWIIEGYINNVFDGNYRIVDGTPTDSTSPYQGSYHQVSTPREFGLRLSYYW